MFLQLLFAPLILHFSIPCMDLDWLASCESFFKHPDSCLWFLPLCSFPHFLTKYWCILGHFQVNSHDSYFLKHYLYFYKNEVWCWEKGMWTLSSSPHIQQCVFTVFSGDWLLRTQHVQVLSYLMTQMMF